MFVGPLMEPLEVMRQTCSELEPKLRKYSAVPVAGADVVPLAPLAPSTSAGNRLPKLLPTLLQVIDAAAPDRTAAPGTTQASAPEKVRPWKNKLKVK
jgi:hypothetical protein